ncbi:hypothetical protein P3T76_012928 [Phytophthora citrophthora]|uniref:Uncharacterized protein n=1 Tax=Phytophthora citrophthora TaxID=4793 RepID=A0AAD9LDR8_9STRA|nr:hypothetical protein P3T76_012928 [Phytophthora citrophthora]
MALTTGWMVSAELDSIEQHEDGVEIQETPAPEDSGINENDQVPIGGEDNVPVVLEEAQPSGGNLSSNDQLTTEPVAATSEPTSSTPAMDLPLSSSEILETTEPDSAETGEVKTEKPIVEPPTPIDEPQTDSMAIAAPIEAENDEQQTSAEPQQNINTEEVESVELPPKPSTFFESLTANFTPDTKAMWAQIFGPRYDDGGEDEILPEVSEPDTESSKTSSKSSLQAKLIRERKLDEQIQASQRRYQERVKRETATKRMATRREQHKSSRRSQTKIPTISPFERVGLSLTQIRFCMEKALDETCKCFHHLHAAALEESDPDPSLVSRGIYVTQRELEQLLHELLNPQEAQRRGTLTGVLDFSNTLEEKIPMAIQLQASWFLPFGQLPELRTLVMKITKRHLSEDKLAILNRHLQKQITVLPLDRKLQHLVLQLSNYQLKDPLSAPIWLQGKRSPDELAQDLLKSIGLASMEAEDVKNFLLFLPVGLVAKTQLPTVMCAQRLVFFRFLIDIVAVERMREEEKPTESLPPASEERPTRRKSTRRRSTKRTSVNIIPEADDCNSEEKATGSVQAVPESVTEDTEMAFSETVGDECEKPSSQLQQRLEEAIAQLRQRLPAIESDVSQDPAIRATYLAAVACHKSVLLMLTNVLLDQLENNIDVDIMADQLQHFIDALQAIEVQKSVQTVTTASQLVTGDRILDPPKFPPPYPESTAPEEENHSENSTRPNFPPPYAITAPSYWTFTPTIPEPKSSIAKLTSKSPSNKTEFRCLFMSKDSPGVGAYNIEQSEKSTFQHRPSYSFGGNKTPESVNKGSTGQQSVLRQRMKSSMTVNEVETPDISSTRVQDGSIQCNIDSNEDLLYNNPPNYNEEDANEPCNEEPRTVETEMDRALRQQQQIFMNEFVQHVVSNHEPPTYFAPREKSKSKPYWATSEVSPGIERFLHRQRRAPSSSKFRPTQSAPVPNTAKPRPPKRTVNNGPPPRQQLDNDQHLAWAARISELYQPEK